MRRLLAAGLVVAVAGCGSAKHDASPPTRIVGLALYDFEADLARASFVKGKPRASATRAALERRAPSAQLAHCRARTCFGFAGWYAFARGPELSGQDVVASSLRAEVDRDTGGPIVVMEFTTRGKNAFLRVTNAEAQRGRRRAGPGTPMLEAAQHFAVVVRGEIVSLPYVDFQKFPNGVSAANGVEISGLGSKTEADRLVRELRGG